MHQIPTPYQMRVDKENQLLALSFPHLEGQPGVFLTYQQASSLAHSLLRIMAEAGDVPALVTETQMDTAIQLWKDVLVDIHSVRGLLEMAFHMPQKKGEHSDEN